MMTDYDVSRHSTVNRRYRHDLTIGYHCQNLPPTFLHQIPNKDLQHVSDPTNCELKELFQESVCVLCFVCQHNLESIQHHFKHIIDKTLSRRLLLCTTDSGISGQNANVELLETENVELGQGLNANLLRKIHSVLEGSKLYDDSGSPVEVKRTLSERSELLPTYASRCEPPSSPRSYHEGINDHLYEPLIHSETVKTLEPQLNIATGRFVEATTLKPNKNGIQILDTLCLPKDTSNVSVDENYIKNIKLPKLKAEYKVKDIADHLNMAITDIDTLVIDTLTEVCFKLPLKARFCVEIHSVLTIIWAFLDKWKQDVVMVKSVTLLSNLLMAKLFLLSLNTDCDLGQTIKVLDKGIIPRISTWLKLKAIDKKVKVLLLGSKRFMEDFVNMVQKDHSVIQLGDWKVSLRKESNQKILLTGVNKMALIEKAASILGLICLKCDSTVHITELPSLFEKTCTDCFTRLKKEKEHAVVYSFSILAIRFMVFCIHNLEETEKAQPCMNTIKTILLNKVWSKDQKETLSQEIWTLITHTCDVVRFEVLNILSSTKYDDMQKITCSVLQTSCQSGQLFITKEAQYYGHEKGRLTPRWSDCKGVFGETEVGMKILVPTKNCVAKGVDDNYKAQQTDGHEKFGNTISILSDLHQNGGHDNIARLLSYQVTQMPLFYAVQTDGAMNFLTFLLARREQKRWCCLTDLYHYIRDAVSAMCYLHSNNMIHRDITSCRFDVFLQQKRLKLSDFRLTKKLHRFTDTICSDVSNTLAVRWSALETLKHDDFSTKSDVWMFALFMFEVFTHGCWPYSELVDKETEDVMHMVITRGYNQSQPTCIPDKVFKLMLSCLEQRAEKRPSVQALQNQLTSILESGLSESDKQCSSYLKLQAKQKKMNGRPELGVPPLIQQLKDRTAVPYYNTKVRTVTMLPLQHEDLIADFEPDIKQDIARGTITVMERLDKFSKEHNLPNYQRLKEINDIPSTRLQKVVDTGETYYTYTYSDRGGESLIDHAFKNGTSENLTKLLYRLAKRVQRFHENGWIVRCLSAKDIWKTDKGKICLLRLGRACELQNDTAGGGHVKDELFKDRQHWLPLEVHRDGFYTKKSDVYMFAMVIYEVFTAVSFNSENPLRNPILCVPFAMTPRNELHEILQNGEVPDKPEHCPASLYKLMTECWKRDAVNRPVISDILKRLKDILKRKDFHTDEDYMSELSSIVPDYSSFSDTDTDTDDEDDAPDNNTLSNEWTELAPPLPTRNGIHTSESTQTNDSGSNDSFPKGPPRPLPHVPKSNSPLSSGSSYPAQSETEDHLEHIRHIPTSSVTEIRFSEHVRTSSECERDNIQVTRRKPRKWVRRKEAFCHELKSPINLPGHGLATRFIPGTLEDSDDYITPIQSHGCNNDLEKKSDYTVIHSPAEKEKDMKWFLSNESSGSGDSFPSGAANPFYK